MLLRITPAMQEYLSDAIEDSVKRQAAQASDGVYLKIHDARRAAKKAGQTVTIVASSADLRELSSRCENEVGSNGVCDENIGYSSAFADRAYWMSRKRAYKALQAQLEAHMVPAAVARSA